VSALDNFWLLYKYSTHTKSHRSDRKFKDHEQSEEIQDPRFAYLQTCEQLKVFPKARMIIREESTKVLDYSNYSMMQKSAQAVAEAIKRYALPIEGVNFSNNGLKGQQCILLVQSLRRHYEQL